MSAIIEVKNLVKKFGKVVAVDNISITIEQGLCFGLLGPNGAGKTTTIEVIENVIPPTSGEIFYKNKPRSASFRNEVGIQFQNTALLNFLTVRETLETFQDLYPKTVRIEELVQLCQLTEFLDQYNDKISGGQRQRFLLALALINRPEVLFLDEPSTGLDPQARRNLWNLIRKIKSEGKTLILTTHYMEEAQHLCDEIAIMDYGKIITRGAPQDLIKHHSQQVTVAGSYVDLFIVFLLGSLSLTALGLILASRGTSEEFTTGILNFISWPMMFLSEVWFSLEGAPQWVKSAAKIFPLTHMLKAVRRIMHDGAGLMDVGPELIILTTMTLAFLIIGASLFSWNK